MARTGGLWKGFPGHPTHPPLTDVTVGALTVAALAAVFGWWGVATELLLPTAYVSMVVGLLFAVPTSVTGLLDLLDLPVTSPARSTAILHLSLMACAVALFLVAVLLLHPGLETGRVPGWAAVTTTVGFVVLTAGGWVGGSLAFGHGVRVHGDIDTPTGEVLRPRPPGEQ